MFVFQFKMEEERKKALEGVKIEPVRKAIETTATATAYNTTARFLAAFERQLRKTPDGKEFLEKSMIRELAMG